MGEFYLEEAVLDVLLEARHEEECLGPARISEQAGIYRDRGTANVMNDAIVTGLLVKLNSSGRVVRCKQENNKGGWKLSDAEFYARRD